MTYSPHYQHLDRLRNRLIPYGYLPICRATGLAASTVTGFLAGQPTSNNMRISTLVKLERFLAENPQPPKKARAYRPRKPLQLYNNFTQ